MPEKIKCLERAIFFWFSEWHQRSKGRSYCSSDLLCKYCQNSPFNLPQFFSARCVVEMIVLPQSVVSLGEAMYQSAFLSLEFRPNLGLVTSLAKHKFTKFRQKFRFNSLSIFLPAMSRGNKVFWFPGLIFSTTIPLFKRELPENARFRCQFRPLRVQKTKKNPKK